MNEEQIHLILREYLANGRSHSWKEKGNKYYHGLRTAVLAKKLRQTLFPQDQEADPVLTVASWFHDLCNGPVSYTHLDVYKRQVFSCSPYRLRKGTV